MSAAVRTAGSAALAVAALPVAGIAALVGFVALMEFLFGRHGFGFFLTFLVCATLVFFPLRFVWRLWKKSEQFVLDMNRQRGLQLNPKMLLGLPSPVFMAFDQPNRKIAICNIATGDCRVEDFSVVLGWRYEWRNRESFEITGQGDRIPRTNLREPTTGTRTTKHSFSVVIELADANHPELQFPVLTERMASQWCARLNAIFNG